MITYKAVHNNNSSDQICYRSAWLVSLAADLEKDKRQATLIGLDADSAHFPAAANLPNNIKLGMLDAFTEDLPAEHAAQYDVVHVRAFSSVVKAGNPGPLIRNAYKMLKPGGYLQWDDMDGGSFKAVAPPEDVASNSSFVVSTTATEQLVATSLQSQKVGLNLDFAWLDQLGLLFKENGLEIIDDQRLTVKKELRSVMTASFLMIHAHIAKIAVRDGCMVGTDRNWDEVWTKAGEEIGQGVSLTMDMIVVVGRKPA
jgi:hypothetical protein